MDISCQEGAIKCLKYLVEELNCKLYKKYSVIAAENNHFECFKFLLDKGCPFDKRSCLASTKNGEI